MNASDNHARILLDSLTPTRRKPRGGKPGASLFSQLAGTARRVHPEAAFSATMARVAYCLRGLLQPQVTRAWFRLLAQPHLAVVSREHPHILSKLQRPYLYRTLPVSGRLKILQAHYGFLAREMTTARLAEIYAGGGYCLVALTLEGVGNFELRLLYADGFSKEGDLTLGLVDCASETVLFSLTFAVSTDTADRRTIFVGGLQGNKRANERERVIAITRGLHGLRPKALLVFALRQVATQWRVNEILAVGNATHIYRHWSFGNRNKQKTVVADYDGFWGECGGMKDGHGLFSIPIHAEPRALSTLKANKRLMYRRRYEILSKFAQQIEQRIKGETY